jgi:hypothetical protein
MSPPLAERLSRAADARGPGFFGALAWPLALPVHWLPAG